MTDGHDEKEDMSKTISQEKEGDKWSSSRRERRKERKKEGNFESVGFSVWLSKGPFTLCFVTQPCDIT